jgi:Ca2+-binding EF-hand superfamily protein
VRYDDGRIADERVANLELLVDGPMDDEEEPYISAPPPPATMEMQQQVASESMWGQKMPAPATYEDEAASPPEMQPPSAGYDTLRPEEAPDSPEPQSPEDGRFASQDAPGFGAEQALQAVKDKIYRNFEDLHGAFKALDRSNNGYVSRGDFFQAMGDIFLANGFTEDDIYEVADHFDLNKDGYLSYEEFVSVVEGGYQGGSGEAPLDESADRSLMDNPILITSVDKAIQKFKIVVDQRYSAIREAFLKMDRDRRGFLTPQMFAQALLAHGVSLSPDELELAYSAFDREGKGVITYTDFCAVMTQRFQFGAHLDRQLYK